MKKNNRLFKKALPFFILGMTLVIGIVFLILFFYLFIWGAIIGLILWVVYALKQKFFPSPSLLSSLKTKYRKVGRIIDVEVISSKASSSKTKKKQGKND